MGSKLLLVLELALQQACKTPWRYFYRSKNSGPIYHCFAFSSRPAECFATHSVRTAVVRSVIPSHCQMNEQNNSLGDAMCSVSGSYVHAYFNLLIRQNVLHINYGTRERAPAEWQLWVSLGRRLLGGGVVTAEMVGVVFCGGWSGALSAGWGGQGVTAEPRAGGQTVFGGWVLIKECGHWGSRAGSGAQVQLHVCLWVAVAEWWHLGSEREVEVGFF